MYSVAISAMEKGFRIGKGYSLGILREESRKYMQN